MSNVVPVGEMSTDCYPKVKQSSVATLRNKRRDIRLTVCNCILPASFVSRGQPPNAAVAHTAGEQGGRGEPQTAAGLGVGWRSEPLVYAANFAAKAGA